MHPSSISRLWELQTECRMNLDGDFQCTVNYTTDIMERKQFLSEEDMKILHMEEAARIGKLLSLNPNKAIDDSSDAKAKRVSYHRYMTRPKSLPVPVDMLSSSEKHRNSEYHTKYEEIVVLNKGHPHRRSHVFESKKDPSECSEFRRSSVA